MAQLTLTSSEISQMVTLAEGLIPAGNLATMLKTLLNFKSFSGNLELVDTVNGQDFTFDIAIK